MLTYIKICLYVYIRLLLDQLLNIQIRSSHLVLRNIVKSIKKYSYIERLEILNLPTLRYRRHTGDMIETFKIVSGHYDSDVKISLYLQTIVDQGVIH